MIHGTERLILRPWLESDAEELFLYAKDPQVGPIAGWPVHTSVENSLEIIRTVLSKPETYAVVLKSSNKPIGSIGLMFQGDGFAPIGVNEAELGFWIGVPYWGNAYAPEASRCLFKYAFEQLNLTAIWCGYYDGNLNSKRVQEKCGFVYQFTKKDCPTPMFDELRTMHFNILTKERWLSMNK